MLLTPDAFHRLCRARELLRQTHEHRLSIPEIALEAHISPFHFIRQSKALFGLTPHQFRICSRLDQAKYPAAAFIMLSGRNEACESN